MLCFAGFNLWPCTTELLPEWETSALSIHRDEGDTISRVLWYSKVLNLLCIQSFNAWTKSRFKQIKWKSNIHVPLCMYYRQYNTYLNSKGKNMLLNTNVFAIHLKFHSQHNLPACLVLVDEGAVMDVQFDKFYHHPPDGFDSIMIEQSLLWLYVCLVDRLRKWCF